MYVVLSAAALATAWALLILETDPVPTWFYVFAWYPTLTLFDAIASRLDGRAPLFKNARLALSLFAWSAIIWLGFEAANLRLANWYYVFVPHRGWERWVGILLSFATVVPAIVLAERTLEAAGVGRRWRTRPVRISPWELRAAVLIGVGTGALALIYPSVFFPFIWGSAFLIADPFVYRHTPKLSLIGDISRGEWGRIGRLMMGGTGVGLIWESYNFWARGKWVYTIPWLEELKLFEMPPFGFLGFTVFALEAWALYHLLCAARVAVPVTGRGVFAGTRLGVALAAAATFATVTLSAMERWTISSTVPRLKDLPHIDAVRAALLSDAGVESPFDLARAEPTSLAAQAGLESAEATAMVETARLTIVRGIGARHAAELQTAGIRTVCELAGAEPAFLWEKIHALHRGLGRRPTEGEVRVWVSAARKECQAARPPNP